MPADSITRLSALNCKLSAIRFALSTPARDDAGMRCRPCGALDGFLLGAHGEAAWPWINQRGEAVYADTRSRWLFA